MSKRTDPVTLDRRLYDLIINALRFTRDASCEWDHAQASQRCLLLLIDLGEATDQGGSDE